MTGCYWCTHDDYHCPRCYSKAGLTHTHESDYLCDACGFVTTFITTDELAYRMATIEQFKRELVVR